MMTLEIYRRLPSTPVADYAAASAAYRAEQEASGEGGSTFPNGGLFRDGDTQVGTISYNGRVWENDGVLVYCPGSVHEDEGRPDIFNAGRESEWGKNVPNPYEAGTVEHTVFKRGAAFALKAYA